MVMLRLVLETEELDDVRCLQVALAGHAMVVLQILNKIRKEILCAQYSDKTD
jgi:hypothetical protein